MESGCEGYQKAVFCESQWLTFHPSFYQLDTKLKRIYFSLFYYQDFGGQEGDTTPEDTCH